MILLPVLGGLEIMDLQLGLMMSSQEKALIVRKGKVSKQVTRIVMSSFPCTIKDNCLFNRVAMLHKL